METEIEILFFAAFAKFLIDPLVWLLSILLAFVSRKKHFLVRVTFIWVAMFLMTLLVLGEMKDYQYIAVSIANFIIAIISTLIIKSKRFDNKKHLQLTNLVGEELYNQIYSALKENEDIAGKNLTEMKATGYIFGFINHFIQESGVEDDDHDEIYKIILNGVLPNKLEEIFIRNSARHELAKTTAGLEGEVEKFNTGIKWGEYDASSSDYTVRPESLKSILLDKKPKIIIN